MDNHATTRVDPRVFEAMAPYFTEVYGMRPAATTFRLAGEEAVERARKQVADLVERIRRKSSSREVPPNPTTAIKGVAEM